ncbi:cold and drought-regulated protein CORA-like [Drosophila elegans]|uniref:cold and drought-regulated protein CORA-like n=1 Tax=Drosophila elegans TaxID=30023 RepID=UPI0007E83EB2|nr:cold and drought-regulated protein CORA-like [Drosophila elegans]
MRLILLSIVGLLCLACAFALNNNGANLEDLLSVAHHGEAHAEVGVRAARGYGGGHGGGHYGGHGHGHHGHGGHGHYGR